VFDSEGLMNKRSSPRRHQFVNLSHPPLRARRVCVVVLALMLLPLTGTSVLRASAQTPDPRDAVAQKALEEAVALVQQRTAEALRAAMSKFETARSLFHETKNQMGEATSLMGLGLAHRELSEKQEALACYNQALSLYRAIGFTAGEAMLLNNIGTVYSDLGEKQKALEYFNLALPLNRAARNRAGEAMALGNIGMAYKSLGEKQKALDYCFQALTLAYAAGTRKAWR
jgi:tetratricopeptide (TPR) repeat protein